MKDLKNPRTIWLKGILFLAIGLTSSSLIWLETRTWRTLLLLCLSAWGFCRAYYFAFYVLEKYVDPRFRFAGLVSLARYIFRSQNRR